MQSADATTTKAPVPKARELTSPAVARRRITYRLLDRAEMATPTPALSGEPRLECIKAPDRSIANPFSKLPSPARKHHARVTLGSKKGRVELRDAFVFGGPRTFTFKRLRAPRAPRLQLGYRVIGCGSRARAVMKVTVQAAGGAARSQKIQLTSPESRTGTQFVDWSQDLAVIAGQTFDLTLEFEGELDPVNRIVLTEPVITGFDAGSATLLDRNILLIIVDAMRGDAVGAGRLLPAPVAPHFESWMGRGVGFEKAMSVSNQTRASTLSMLQGQPPSVGQFHATSWQLNKARKERYHDSDPPLVTRRLAAAGHRVVSIGHNRFLWNSAPIGLDHGYDQVVDIRAMTDDTPAITDEAIAWLKANANDRFFLTVNYTAPHNPYAPPQGYTERAGDLIAKKDRRGLPRSYLGEIAFVDDHIARLKKAFDDLKLGPSTLVVVTADHGETFHALHACRSERFKMNCHSNHGLTLYDEEVHVPLALVLDGQLPTLEVKPIVSHLALAPTLLSVLGLPRDPRHTTPSLLDGALGKGSFGPGVAYVETRAASGLRTPGHKLIVHHPRNDVSPPSRTGGSGGRGPLTELYDLKADPRETENLVLGEKAEGSKATVERLNRRLARIRTELKTAVQTSLGSEPSTPGQTAPSDARLWSRDGVRVAGGPDGVSYYLRLGPARCVANATSQCRPVDASELAVEFVGDVAPGKIVDIQFETTAQTGAGTSGVTVEARLDGVTLDPSQIRVGPFGVAGPSRKPGTTTLTPDQLTYALGAHPPHVAALDAPQLFYWRLDGAAVARYGDLDMAGPESLGAGNDGDDAGMSGEVRRLLKDLGYSQ